MIAVDWSYTKDLTTYDGKKIRVEDKATLLKRLSTINLKSIIAIVLEQGCPLSLIYDLTRTGCQVKLIDNRATENYRKEHGVEKTDENDARIIYELSNNGSGLKLAVPDSQSIRAHSLYHQYRHIQKARIALQNMKKSCLRHYGLGETKIKDKSVIPLQPSPDVYDAAIAEFRNREKTLMGGETNEGILSIFISQPPIKGLGKRIWWGIVVTANPQNFKCLSAYLRFCGLTDDVAKSHKYNRHARMLYRMLAESTLKARNAEYRAIYDKCKADIVERHPNYAKGHIHNAALNRTATFLAKEMFNYCKEG